MEGKHEKRSNYRLPCLSLVLIQSILLCGCQGTNSHKQSKTNMVTVSGITKPDKTPDFDINNLGDGRDDDAIARQLRELAEHETDKAMKAELWKRYIKYKNR